MAKPLNDIRCRVRGLRMVRACDVRPHPLNFRRHGKQQRSAIRLLLKQVGFADVLLTYEEADGSLVYFDGHLRAEESGDALVPVIETDLTPAEARVMLRAMDPVSALADEDPEALAALVEAVDDAGLEALLGAGDAENQEPAPPEEEAWKTLTFRVPASAVPVIEGQVERIGELCGYDRKTRGLALERLAILASTASEEELSGE